jgi:hypothetical protein
MGFFKSIGRAFKSIATDILPPAILGIAGGPVYGPFLAAAYSGIKTGVETGSPFAGIGSAAMSFGLAKIGQGIGDVGKAAPVGPLGGTSPIEATNAASLRASMGAGQSAILGPSGTAITTPGALGAGRVGSLIPGTAGVSSLPLGATEMFTPIKDAATGASRIISRPDLVPPPRTGIMGFAKDAVDVAMKPAPLFKNIAGIDTGINYEMRPATLAGLGFVAKQAGTPLPEPEPLPPIQFANQKRDLSRFAYKGPLQRGEYQYADPESLYGKRDASTYGYVGAKEGGVMKFQLGGAPMIGGFSPIDPNMRPVPSIPRTGGEPSINIVSPPGGQAEPISTANFIGPAPINQPPMTGITQTLQKAGQQQQGMPTPSPTQTLQGLSQQLSKDVNLQPPAPLPAQAPMMPQQQLDVQGLLNQKGMNELSNLIKDLPRKPLDISISGLGSLGLAVGGQVPGMAGVSPISQTTMSPIAPQQSPTTPAQERPKNLTIGPSSTMDPTAVETTKAVYGEGGDPGEEEFINMFSSIFNSNPNIVTRIAQKELIPQVGSQMYQQMKDANAFAPGLAIQQPTIPAIGEDKEPKQMAEGGEVESNQMLQENAFVIPADVVGHIGDGSSDAGAQRLQQFLGMNPQQYQAGGIMAGELQGPGGGMDDLIQTSIEGKQAAAVSPQEFVVPRDIVAELGKGSYDQGSKKLYALMRNVRKFKTGKTEQPAELNRGLNNLMRSAVA